MEGLRTNQCSRFHLHLIGFDGSGVAIGTFDLRCKTSQCYRKLWAGMKTYRCESDDVLELPEELGHVGAGSI